MKNLPAVPVSTPFLPGVLAPSRYATAMHIDTGDREYIINRQRTANYPRQDDIIHFWAEGEWLDRVAQIYFGDPTLWWIIADFNLDIDPRVIQVGYQLRIPNRRRLVLSILPNTV